MGMAIDGASHHDSLGAVFGSEGSAKGAVGGTWVNLPAGLLTKAAGQTRHRSSTPTDRCPSYRMHVSRHDRGDDPMDRGARIRRSLKSAFPSL